MEQLLRNGRMLTRKKMKRTNKKQPDLILTDDWHLRDDKPVARVDDFWEAQWEKVRFIAALQRKYECPVWHAGDLFHVWKQSPYLLAKTAKELPKEFWTIYGNHDLPQHSMALKEKTGVHLLETVGKLNILNQPHWQYKPEDFEPIVIKGRKILVWHIMAYTGYIPFATDGDWKAEELLKAHPEYDLILTGHNHNSFVHEEGGRVLVNPGAITRQNAADVNNEPCVYLWYADTNTVEEVLLPIIDENAITREHIRVKEEKSERLEAFISKLNTEWDTSINFEQNIKAFEQNNKVLPSVMEIVHELINLKSIETW